MLLQPRAKVEAATVFATDESGYFGIRLESIGGYGAHIAGRILTEACILRQGLNGSNFSSYGSEKKGTPVKAFVRLVAPDAEVRTSAPVEEPHVVGIFHEALIRTQAVVSGLRRGGTVILNTTKTLDQTRNLLKLDQGKVGVVDAIGIAIAEGSRANMVMMGAVCRAVPFIDPDAVKEGIREAFGKKYAKTIPGNLRAFDRGLDEVQFMETVAPADYVPAPIRRQPPAYGYLNAPIGGVILNPGNMMLKDLSASRQGHLPELLRDKCIDCAQCDLVCPDMCFVWDLETDKKGKPVMVLRGIDYTYCKGCLKCVEACPTDALLMRREEDGFADAHRVAQRFA